MASNPISDILTGGFSGVVDAVSGIIGRFVTDPNAKLAASLELAKVQNDYNVQLLQADKDFAVAQASVVVAEAKSESWLARNWRPILMLVITSILAFNYLIAPLINMFAGGSLKALDIPPQMWAMLTIGTSGYIVGRSVEKVSDTKAARDITVANVQANAPGGA